jgi:cell division protein FtsW (lipid II flippase)
MVRVLITTFVFFALIGSIYFLAQPPLSIFVLAIISGIAALWATIYYILEDYFD